MTSIRRRARIYTPAVVAFCLPLCQQHLSSQPRVPPPQRLKVHISVDMEGVTGVVTLDQLLPGGFEYERFREFMTKEALAAIEGARAAGATEIVVADSHGNGENLLVERFPRDIRIVRSWPRPLGMMEGIDSTFDAAVFIGYHASANSTSGIRAHTNISRRFTSVELNGRPLPESGMNAAIAGHFGVPVVFISGDESATKELRQLVPGAGAAVVKESIALNSGITLTPEAGQDLIRQGVARALADRRTVSPFKVTSPIRLDVVFTMIRPSELLAYLKGVTRTSSRSVRSTLGSMREVAAFLQFIQSYNIDLEP